MKLDRNLKKRQSSNRCKKKYNCLIKTTSWRRRFIRLSKTTGSCKFGFWKIKYCKLNQNIKRSLMKKWFWIIRLAKCTNRLIKLNTHKKKKNFKSIEFKQNWKRLSKQLLILIQEEIPSARSNCSFSVNMKIKIVFSINYLNLRMKSNRSLIKIK